MSLSMMKALTAVFWIAVAGIGLSFGMTVYTGVREHRNRQSAQPAPEAIPIPAPAAS